jgi:hypothetical protein
MINSSTTTTMLAHLKRAFAEVVGKDAEEFDSTVTGSDVKYIRGIRDETTWTMSYSARAKSTMLTYRRPVGSATTPPKEVLLVREVDRKRKFPQTTAALSKAAQSVSASVLVPNREAKSMMSGVNVPPTFKDALAHPTNAIMIAKAIALVSAKHTAAAAAEAAAAATATTAQQTTTATTALHMK